MGQVHRAWDRRLERPVAVKFVRGPDPQEAERLLLEARLQARVDHPHVVRVHEVGSLEGRPCIVFQLVEGRTLADVAVELPTDARVELVRQAALGVHAAHLQGLIHRDVKPGNVLVEEGEGGRRTALVTDFGLARADEGGLTRSGMLAGTLDFMSPEQVLGTGPVDFRADVYALGATLYAVVAGRPPFRLPAAARAGEQAGLLRRILEEEPPPLAAVAPSAPRDLTRVAQKAMEKDPAARYPTAEALADDLGRFQRGEPVRARPAPAAERAAKWARRNRTAARALAVAVLAVAAGGGWALWTSRRAGAEALDAARLGAAAEAMESRVRMEHLSPPHDLRPALAAVRAEVDALRAAGAAATGPAQLALGTGLEILGDLDGAREAYERAWGAGFRTPRLAERLGFALGRLYQREVERAARSLRPEAREARTAELRAGLRDPALRHLAQGERGGWRGPYLRAFVALIEEDFAAARVRAGEALAADEGRYEARLLEGEAWLLEAAALLDAQKLAEAESAARRGGERLEEARDWGRSDPRLHELIAKGHDLVATSRTRRGLPDEGRFGMALQALEQASALDADAAGPLVLRAEVLVEWSGTLGDSAVPGPLDLLEQASGLLRSALEKDPRNVRARLRLANASYRRAFRLRQLGRPSQPAVDEGLSAVAAAAAAAPEDPDWRFAGMLLRAEEAEERQRTGGDGAPAYREAVRLGEEALRLGYRSPVAVQGLMGQALVQLGREAWLSGRDPRPEVARGVELSEEARRAAPGHANRAAHLLFALGTESEMLAAVGDDPRPPLARALFVADEALGSSPGHPVLIVNKGELLLREAALRARAGEDPRATLAEAERLLLEGARAFGGRTVVLESLASVPAAEARWRAARGLDPADALARAERAFAEVLRSQPDARGAREALADAARERAAWFASQGRPAAAEARRGLAHVEKAIAAGGRDARLWVLRARLEVLSGDREAARRSLATARERNPLVLGSAEGQAAASEVGP
jgi:serine/threonine-protein kinase